MRLTADAQFRRCRFAGGGPPGRDGARTAAFRPHPPAFPAPRLPQPRRSAPLAPLTDSSQTARGSERTAAPGARASHRGGDVEPANLPLQPPFEAQGPPSCPWASLSPRGGGEEGGQKGSGWYFLRLFRVEQPFAYYKVLVTV